MTDILILDFFHIDKEMQGTRLAGAAFREILRNHLKTCG